MDPEILLEAIGEIDLVEVRGARPEKTRKGTGRRFAWAGAAAAAVLAAALILPRFLAPRGFTTERIEDLSTVTDAYQGTLLAENLLAAGAELSDIELQHLPDRDVADASGWKSLSFTAERGEERLEMTCTFGVPENYALPGLPDETLEYAGVTVWLFISETEGRADTPYTCRTVFICEGVVYEMELGMRSADDLATVRASLEMVLGVEGTAVGAFHPLEDLMGFDDYRVTVDAQPGEASTWHFWLDLSGWPMCAAEATGPDGEPQVYGVDLDGDGRDELVANNKSAAGAETVSVYRYSDGQFYVGWIDESLYGGADAAGREGERAVSARFDAERNVFEVDYTPAGQSAVRTVTFSGTEHLLFRRFAAAEGDHFAPRPLSYDELEHTDRKPVETVFWYEDYRVGIEHTAEQDIWHFFTGIQCLAEAEARPGGTPEVFSAQLNGGETDMPDLVVNRPDGTVKVYADLDDDIKELTLREDVLEAALAHAPGGSGSVTARFDPETNRFTITVAGRGQETPVYTESFDFDVEKFSAVPAAHRLYGQPETFTVGPASGQTGDSPIDPAEAVDALRRVLTGEADFQNTREDGEPIARLNLDTVGEVMTPGGAEWFEAREFAVVDMDGDGVKEAILRLYKKTGDEYDMCSVVLHYTGGDVKGYMIYARGFQDLQTDGVFYSSGGTGTYSFCRLEFSGARCITHVVVGVDNYDGSTLISGAQSPEELDAILEAMSAVPEAEWYPLTDENIEKQLG